MTTQTNERPADSEGRLHTASSPHAKPQQKHTTPQPADTAAPPESPQPGWSWGRIITFAGLVVLGVTPWAQAQLPPPNDPALCPPLTAFAGPTFFDYFWGTTPIRFPYQ